MVKIAHLYDALAELFQLEASLVEGQSMQQKDRMRKRKGKKQKIRKKNPKPEDIAHFLISKFLFLHMPKQKCCKIRC